ncbi:MAG: hypothetical protein AAFU78_14565 [Cyanobacteria bacterium J06633_2]
MEKFEKYKRQEFNLQSQTDAIGWAGILNAFRGKDAKPISYFDLLPFQNDINKPKEKSLSDKTAGILARLIKEKKLPKQAASLASAMWEVQERLKKWQ